MLGTQIKKMEAGTIDFLQQFEAPLRIELYGS